MRPTFLLHVVIAMNLCVAPGCSACSSSDGSLGGGRDAGSSDDDGGAAGMDGGDDADGGGDDEDSGGSDLDGGASGDDAGSAEVDAGSGEIDAGALDAGGPEPDAGEAGEVDAGPVECMGTHPLVMGTRRYCNPGDCFCADPDACFPAATADECCPGAVVCPTREPDAGVECEGAHPLVEMGRRFCNPGNCFCAAPDACFPTATADACCPGTITCY